MEDDIIREMRFNCIEKALRINCCNEKYGINEVIAAAKQIEEYIVNGVAS